MVASLLGLATTSSAFFGAALGLYVPFSRRVLACVLAFAAGALISALAIELAFEGAQALHHQGFGAASAWAFVAGGSGIGAMAYYWASLYLERRGAALRYPTRFQEYALERKQREMKELIELLSTCDLLRHLPPEEIEGMIPCVKTRHLGAGEVLFRVGDPGDALYIVAKGQVEVLAGSAADPAAKSHSIARLVEGNAFGEMALASEGVRTATNRAVDETELLR